MRIATLHTHLSTLFCMIWVGLFSSGLLAVEREGATENIEDRFLRFNIGESPEGDLLYQRFDGTYSFDLGASLASARTFKDATLLVRFRTTESRNFMTLFSCTGNQTNLPPNGVMLGLNNHGQLVYRGRNLAGKEFHGTAGLGYNDGRWHTAVVSSDSRGSLLYVDGVPLTHMPQRNFLSFLESPNDMRIGVTRFARPPLERWFFFGDVDTAEILGKCLSPAEILSAGDRPRPVPWTKPYRIPLKNPEGRIAPLILDRDPNRSFHTISTVLLPRDNTLVTTYSDRGGETFWRSSPDLGLRWTPRRPTPKPSGMTGRSAGSLFYHKGKRSDHVVWLRDGRPGFHMHLLPVSHRDGIMGQTWQAASSWGTRGNLPVVDAGAGLVALPQSGFFRMVAHDGVGRGLTSLMPMGDQMKGGAAPFSWSAPERFQPAAGLGHATPCVIPSPDGKRLALIQASKTGLARICYSGNGGQTFTPSVPLPPSLQGTHHVAAMDPQSKRLLVVFFDRSKGPFVRESGDWIGWVGTFDDLLRGREGKYRVRLLKHWGGPGSGRSGVVVCSERGRDRGLFVVNGAGTWMPGEPPYVVQYRFKLGELDRLPAFK